jgi:TolA-binding protein
MNRNSANRAPVFVIAIACAALMATAIAAADSQGITAQATTGKTDPAREITALRQQVQALEKRVAELEKGDLEQSKEDDAGDAREKKLEQRLAQLEKTQESAKSDGTARNKQEQADGNAPMTVRAPFVVQDDGGRTIFRVDIAPNASRARIMVGNPIGARAEIGPNEFGGAVIGLFDSTNALRVALVGRQAEAELQLRGSKTLGVQLKSDDVGGDLHLFNAAGLGNARLTIGKGGAGSFTLGDAGGATVVSAGTLSNGIGIIKAGPGGFGPAGVAGGVMPASSIQGRK